MKNNKIKIAFVMPSMAVGGLESSVLRIGSFLKKSGYDVSIITTEEPGEWFEKIAQNNLAGKHISGLKRWFPYIHAYRVGKALRDDNYDVIFTVFDRFSQAALGMLPENVIVIPLLRNDHKDIYDIGLANKNKWNIAIGNSPKIYEVAKRIVGDDRRVALIPNGVDIPQDWRPRTTDDWKQPLRLAFVGRIVHESKGVLLLPEIIKKCGELGLNLSLTIAGDGPDKEKLLQKSVELGVADKIRLLGAVSHSEVKELLLSSHMLLFTSYYEGLPNVVIEAQACGCIPVASRLAGSTDFLIKDSVTGLLVKNDVDCFAEAVYLLSQNALISIQMSINAHQHVSENFSKEAEGNKFLEVIRYGLQGNYSLPESRSAIFPISIKLFSWKHIYNTVLKPKLSHLSHKIMSKKKKNIRQDEKESLYYFSSINYAFLMQRPQQLFKAWQNTQEKLFEFFYVEPPQFRKSKSDVLFTIRPFCLPFKRYGINFLEGINRFFIRRSINKSFGKGLRKIAVVSVFSWEPFLSKRNFDIICYDYLDAIEVHSQNGNFKEAKVMHYKLLQKSDIIFVTSDKLRDEVLSVTGVKDVYTVSNGVDIDFFEKNAFNNKISDYQKNDNKTVGYVGALFNWIDIEIIFNAALQLPEIDFVLVGPLSEDNEHYLKDKPCNVYFLGAKEYRLIPSYIAAFDVALIPFKTSIIAESTDPIKLYEYFSLGKPVVSTKMRQLEKYNDGCILRTVESCEEFVQAIKFFLFNDNEAWQEKRRTIAIENSWEKKAVFMLKSIKSKFQI